MTELEKGWLIGILEGEGSFVWHQTKRDKGRPRIQIQMTDKDVMEKVAKLLGTHMTGPYGPYTTQKLPAYYVHCSGVKAYENMKTILPFMGKRRTEQIKPLMEKYENLIGGH